MLDHAKVDHVGDSHDDDGRQCCVRDVVEHRSQKCQSQQYQRSYKWHQKLTTPRPTAHAVHTAEVFKLCI